MSELELLREVLRAQPNEEITRIVHTVNMEMMLSMAECQKRLLQTREIDDICTEMTFGSSDSKGIYKVSTICEPDAPYFRHKRTKLS
jgi:hypothetical protein